MGHKSLLPPRVHDDEPASLTLSDVVVGGPGETQIDPIRQKGSEALACPTGEMHLDIARLVASGPPANQFPREAGPDRAVTVGDWEGQLDRLPALKGSRSIVHQTLVEPRRQRAYVTLVPFASSRPDQNPVESGC
jgi:hypothetical protein